MPHASPNVHIETFNLFLNEIHSCLITNKKRVEINKENLTLVLDTSYNQVVYRLKHSGEEIACFSLHTLHGCCGVCVSYHSVIRFSYRGIGLGNILCKLRVEIAKRARYGLMICTVVEDNVPQKKIMETCNFSKAVSFVNPKTKNLVNLHYIKLNEQ